MPTRNKSVGAVIARTYENYYSLAENPVVVLEPGTNMFRHSKPGVFH